MSMYDPDDAPPERRLTTSAGLVLALAASAAISAAIVCTSYAIARMNWFERYLLLGATVLFVVVAIAILTVVGSVKAGKAAVRAVQRRGEDDGADTGDLTAILDAVREADRDAPTQEIPAVGELPAPAAHPVYVGRRRREPRYHLTVGEDT